MSGDGYRSSSYSQAVTWDVWVLAPGKDSLKAGADDLKLVTVPAPNPSAARGHSNVERAIAKGWIVLDVCVSGVLSPEVARIQSRARRAADDEARARFSRDGADPAVASIIGSRPLG
jgi:hypothetical protein